MMCVMGLKWEIYHKWHHKISIISKKGMKLRLTGGINTRMLLQLLLYFSTAVMYCHSSIPPTCKWKIRTKQYPSYYNLNKTPLKSEFFSIMLSDENEQNCSLNLTQIVPQMKLPDFPVFQIIGIICKNRHHVYFTEFSGRAKHVIFHVEVKMCTINMKNLDNLLNIGDARVLIVHGKIQPDDTTDENEKQEEGLKNVVTFFYGNPASENQSVTDVFKINTSYPNLVEIILKNITIDVNMNQLSNMLPNLQSLELPENGIKFPPISFPWTNTLVMLPRNLSRSPLMQNHYNDVDFIKVQSNIFRRYFNLEGNEIKNLSEYVFHGHIDKISLKGNGLYAIGDKTFRNLTGIQNIDLANNLIRNLPSNSFKGLRTLQKLELGGNMIVTLLNDLFKDLISLRYIGLANNSIKQLPTGMFHPLQKIETIRLDHNKISDVNPDAFSLNAIMLKEIHFQFNPITDLPYFPFYMRGLKLVNFQSTNISLGNFTEFLLGFDEIQVYNTIVDTASDSDKSDVMKRAEVLRKVVLSNCNITNIQLTMHQPTEISHLLIALLLHFKFDIRNNPIKCDCGINPLVYFINGYADNGTIPENEYFFNDWICQYPSELNGHKMLSVKAEETYCRVNVSNCPRECLCYKRPKIEHLIVDCRGKGLKVLHNDLPEGKLELWYSDNNLTNINSIPFPERITVFDVSNNKLEFINGDVIKRMTSLQTLRVHSNVLAYIPNEITELVLKSVSIFPNPLTCDCHTLWLKNWIANNKLVIMNWNEVSCKIENEDGMVVVEVPDDKFECDEEFDQLRKVVLPSVICSVLTLIFVIIFAVIYAYRLECKVLMFVYLGIHPFDRDSQGGREELDCVIIHSGLQTDWVMNEIVTLLENENYDFVVCDMARDFVIGFSFQENLTRTVRHSKRMIVCLSDDWQTTSDSFTTAWRIAREKIRATRSHYGIIVSHEINKTNIHDKDLNRFIKRGRFVDSKDSFFRNKIIYYMPQIVRPKSKTITVKNSYLYISQSFSNKVFEDNETNVQEETCHVTQAFVEPDHPLQVTDERLQSHAFISYHKDDFQYVLNELLPLLQGKGFSYCISDRDFVPGASIEENILNAVDRSHRTIFILTPAHVKDEWSLFTFRAAYEKALREKSNHLLVIIKEEVDIANLDEEMKHYLNNYICLHINDKWFEKKLFNGLPLIQDHKDLHTFPLFMRFNSIDEKTLQLTSRENLKYA